MDRIEVKSSNIKSIGYDEKLKILEVEFLTKDIYHYYDVPKNVHKQIMESDSQGKFLNYKIKGNYKYEIIYKSNKKEF